MRKIEKQRRIAAILRAQAKLQAELDELLGFDASGSENFRDDWFKSNTGQDCCRRGHVAAHLTFATI